MNNVIIVDDHPIVREGFKKLNDSEKDLKVIGTAESSSEAAELIPKELPDIAMVDLSLKDRSGIELIKDLQAICPDVKILVVSLHDEEVYAERALKAGAKGFIMKAEAVDDIINAVKKVLNGEMYLSRAMQSRLIEKLAKGKINQQEDSVDILSDREFEVFQLIGRGLDSKSIAKKMQLSVKTVETYKSHIKIKLELSNSIELIQRAVEWKMEHKIA
ncbi:MAG: response regulator transcription factor [Spirochaetales bacterium]|nr:response regulator transcription factor [Spirochaetales bacterium]